MKLADPALEDLVMNLVKVFTKHFRHPATVLGKDARSASRTPFTAFVLAVCAEQKIPMTPALVSAIGRRKGLPVEAEEEDE